MQRSRSGVASVSKLRISLACYTPSVVNDAFHCIDTDTDTNINIAIAPFMTFQSDAMIFYYVEDLLDGKDCCCCNFSFGLHFDFSSTLSLALALTLSLTLFLHPHALFQQAPYHNSLSLSTYLFPSQQYTFFFF